jgi:hypothetical protein
MKNVVVVSILAILLAILLIVGAILFLLALSSVAPKCETSDLIGNYVGSYYGIIGLTSNVRKGVYNGGTHSLELKSDGTYTYVYNPIDANAVETVGAWRFTRKYTPPNVVLDGFLLAPTTDSQEKPGVRYLNIHTSPFKPIRLSIDYDLGYCWVKLKERR